MNNKGFTFIELLAILVLLAVVLVITVPSVGDLISNYRENGKVEMLKKSAISAAKEYVVDGNISIDLSSCLNSKNIDISIREDLIDSKYLDEKENEENAENTWYNSEHKIRVTYDCVNKKFTEYKYCIKINDDDDCIEN